LNTEILTKPVPDTCNISLMLGLSISLGSRAVKFHALANTIHIYVKLLSRVTWGGQHVHRVRGISRMTQDAYTWTDRGPKQQPGELRKNF
jgi:hypothetical protein